MLFANPRGVQGNVVSKGVNEFIIPNYKQTWANIRKIASAPEATNHLSFKSPEYSVELIRQSAAAVPIADARRSRSSITCEFVHPLGFLMAPWRRLLGGN